MPAPKTPARIPLTKLINTIRLAQRATIVFGAGMSVALSGAEATWPAFLNKLVNSLDDRHKRTYKIAQNKSYWVGAEALEHRLHSIRSLAHGDADAAVASTYLIDRIHAVHGRVAHPVWPTVARSEDVNAAALSIERNWLANAKDRTISKWNALFGRMGVKSRQGQLFLVTTNFDHCIAQATGLPIFIGGWKMPFNRKSQFHKARPNGVIIRKSRLADANIWRDQDIDSSNSAGVSPRVFADAWKYPRTIPKSWWPDVASVFHVHGSRLITPSVVFDASSYSMLNEGSPVLGAGDILKCLIDIPTASGPIIFAGCKGTLLDPHFIQYWNRVGTVPGAERIVLQLDSEIDPLARELHGHFLGQPPQLCGYGKTHVGLLDALSKIESAL